jgi:hypothetical protein
MISHSIRAALAATAFAAIAFSAFAAPSARAAAPFDGPWSVVVVTRSGPCDQSYRYGVMIRGGSVTYLGGGAVSVSGRVNSAGHVSVSVSSGGQSAFGSGRLRDGRGGGTWRGQGPQGSCSGTWSASQG